MTHANYSVLSERDLFGLGSWRKSGFTETRLFSIGE